MRPPGSVCDVPCGIGVQLHASRVPCQIFIIPLGADHGAVVATEFQRRQVQPDARLLAGPLEILPDDGVGRHAAGGTEHGAAGLLRRLHGPGHQRIADGKSEAKRS